MAIQIHNLSFRYRERTALDRVSFHVEAGSIVGLLGANGAGKSTLMRTLCGLLRPASGSVSIAGFTLPARIVQARSKTGYVAQQFGLYEDLSVEENLLFYAQAYGLGTQSATVRIEEAITRFDLAKYRRDRAGHLSHGWRQRVALACALTHSPKVLLLDEATAGLDPAARRQVWRIIEEEKARGGAVLTSTHHLDEAAACDSVVWLDAGKVAGHGKYKELADRLNAHFEQLAEPA
jgi:ABC-2 type transport system ATP-binding protein